MSDEEEGVWVRHEGCQEEGSCIPERAPFSDGAPWAAWRGSWHWGCMTGGSWLSVQPEFYFRVGIGWCIGGGSQ